MSSYPNLDELNVPIHTEDGFSFPGVWWNELREVLTKQGISLIKFKKEFGLRTSGGNGMYLWDVESTLKKIKEGENNDK